MPRTEIKNEEAEIARYNEAKDIAIGQLNALCNAAAKKAGRDNAAIFEAQVMLLKDEDFTDSVHSVIKSLHANAEYAVAAAGENTAKIFAAMEDDYFRARAADIRDISERVIRVLSGGEAQIQPEGPVIVMADDLLPSEVIQFDRDRILAVVTRSGSSNSHTAILVRSMNIPALTGVPVDPCWEGKTAIVDGHTGTFYLDPDGETLVRMKAKTEQEMENGRHLQELKGKKNVTLDGREIELYANIGGADEVAAVLQNDGGGIGLFRSEYLYLGRDGAPSEEEQFRVYRAVAEAMAGRKVIFRTVDLGADKQAGYLQTEREDNPALGCRGIRLCLTRPEIFRTQLRALFRASAFGKVAILYPMITSVTEVKEIRRITALVRAEPTKECIPFDPDVEEGIMIETPAAAMISDELAGEADFFSIGTNDLTQYTLAMDRKNGTLEAFYDPHHEAVMRLIGMTVRNGHAAGIRVGICGELGADTSLTEQFLQMGVDELSVSTSMILPVREAIRRSYAGGNQPYDSQSVQHR